MSSTKKRVLLLGRLGGNIPTAAEIQSKNIELLTGSDLTDVQKTFDNHPPIDVVIIGAGIELDLRLAIIRHIFTVSDATTVHLKDPATGPQGFLSFVNHVLKGLVAE